MRLDRRPGRALLLVQFGQGGPQPMRTRVLAVFILAGTAITVTLSLIRGQERPAPRPAVTQPGSPVVEGPRAEKAAPARPLRDLSSLGELQKQVLLSGQRGADWMFRMHGIKGRFVYGYLPALKQELEGDQYLRQAGAAFALARAARFTGEERYAVRATQAILALLDETTVDSGDSTVRHTTLPSGLVNRLGSAGLLVLAINELPAPQKDLLDKSEQLCNYIRKQARPDGSLAYGDSSADEEGVNYYPGEALYGLARSQRHRPAEWKVDLLKRSLAHYRGWWKEHRNMAFVPWTSAACAETYKHTKDRTCADFVAEMNDWVCTLQYSQIEPRRMLWYGGFMSYQDGRPVETAPTVASAAYAEGLVEACRVAREQGDLTRFQRYSEAIERCLQFLTTLQYTDSCTLHFAVWYRPQIVGAFHGSHQDGNLRIDYTQHAVSGMFGYLEHVAR
jgi:hypothetical protein